MEAFSGKELYFGRQDVFQTGTIPKKCLKVIPSSKGKQQKVVVGDDAGTINLFSVRKGETMVKLKINNASSKGVTAVELGGAHKGKKDNIYTAYGQSIRGINKKGKEILRFDTNTTENIQNMFIDGNKIWATGDYTMNHFVDKVQSNNFYMSTDRINDLTCEYLSSDAEYDAILACQDRVVRFIQGSELGYDAAIDGPASTLERYYTKANRQGGGGDKQILYGTTNGYVGQLLANNTEVNRGWTLSADDKNTDETLAGVVSLSTADMTHDGTNDILVGRDDGSIEIYSFFESLNTPSLVYKRNIGETIRCIDHGYITTPDKEEIIVGTYSGKVIAFTEGLPPSAEIIKTSKGPSEGEKKIKALQGELEKLSVQIQKQKAKLKSTSANAQIPVVQFKVTDKFQLNNKESVYYLTIETNVSLDCLVLQSNAKVEFEDVDKSLTVMSKTTIVSASPSATAPIADADGNQSLATCRIVENQTTRVQIKARTTEGSFGQLQVFVIPRQAPKSTQVCTFAVKPLSLHYRINEEDLPFNIKDIDQSSHLRFNELKIEGNFTISDIHSWLYFSVPELSEKVNTEESEVYYRSSFSGTHLLCSYRAQKGLFRSESVSTLSLLKECISREATSRGSHFNINLAIKEDTVFRVLDIIHPKVDHLLGLAKKIKIIEALRELKVQEEDISFLSPDYIYILENAESIIQQFKQQPRDLEFVHAFINNLYISKFKFKGINAKPRLPALKKLLDDYSLDRLKEFFAQPVQ